CPERTLLGRWYRRQGRETMTAAPQHWHEMLRRMHRHRDSVGGPLVELARQLAFGPRGEQLYPLGGRSDLALALNPWEVETTAYQPHVHIIWSGKERFRVGYWEVHEHVETLEVLDAC